jgi:transcriptional regulator with XRE-family HTH domain
MSFFAKNLRFLRNSRNLSQDAFAKSVGMNRGNIASYEKGLAEPNSVRLLKIARFFGVPLEAMIAEEFATSGVNYAEGGKPQPRLTKAEIEELHVEAERLERMYKGLKEFHALRDPEEEMNLRNMRDLSVDYERLVTLSDHILTLLNRLLDTHQK